MRRNARTAADTRTAPPNLHTEFYPYLTEPNTSVAKRGTYICSPLQCYSSSELPVRVLILV
jgi:hypothetical protein